mmetsp:Transcript_20868/g.43863  ORF Transcript_20868/g.43863 Transcript_20868/m.43863 type:complete len:81 (+) Transcript_20868:343-585(+)
MIFGKILQSSLSYIDARLNGFVQNSLPVTQPRPIIAGPQFNDSRPPTIKFSSQADLQSVPTMEAWHYRQQLLYDSGRPSV